MTRISRIEFIPCTIARLIGDGVYFRPIRSWHSGTFAGEGLFRVNGDGSGCLVENSQPFRNMCSRPLSVTHRIYWHVRNPEDCRSAFLSYPGGMGHYGLDLNGGEYFWEVFNVKPHEDDCMRFGGENAEAEMEEAIRKHFNSK